MKSSEKIETFFYCCWDSFGRELDLPILDPHGDVGRIGPGLQLFLQRAEAPPGAPWNQSALHRQELRRRADHLGQTVWHVWRQGCHQGANRIRAHCGGAVLWLFLHSTQVLQEHLETTQETKFMEGVERKFSSLRKFWENFEPTLRKFGTLLLTLTKT